MVIPGSTQDKCNAKARELGSFYPATDARARVHGRALDLQDTTNLEQGLTALLEDITCGGEKKFDHIVFTAGTTVGSKEIGSVTAEEAMATFHRRWLSTVLTGKLLASGRYMASSATSSFTLTSGTLAKKPIKGSALTAS